MNPILTPQIEQAILFLAKNFNRHLSLERVSEEVGLSKFHFHRLFKEVTNETLLEYIHRLRMEHATHLLFMYSEIPLIEIAFETGYNTPAEFARVFKKRFGISASRYRTNIQRKNRTENSALPLRIPIVFRKRVTLFVRSSNLLKTNLDQLYESFRNQKKNGKVYYGVFIDVPFHQYLDKCRYYGGCEAHETPKKSELSYTLDEGYYTYLDIHGNFSEISNQIIQFKEQKIDSSDYEIASFVSFEKLLIPQSSCAFDYFSVPRRLFIKVKKR